MMSALIGNASTGPLAPTPSPSETIIKALEVLKGIEEFVQEANSGSWLGEFGGVSPSGSSTSATFNPVAASGIVEAWILQYLSPLPEWLQELTGNLGEVSAGVATWGKTARSSYSAADDLQALLTGVGDETSQTLDAYRERVNLVQRILRAEGDAASQIAGILGKLGDIVQFLSDMVRRFIDEGLSLFSHSVTEVLFTAGTALPLVIARISAWAAEKVAQIMEWLPAAFKVFSRVTMLLMKYAGTLFPIGLGILSAKRGVTRAGRLNPGRESRREEPPHDGVPGGGLGDPVPGEKAPMPRPIPWQYPGDTPTEGSGPHGQRAPNLRDGIVHELATDAALGLSTVLPDASKNLLHFLGNSGTPFKADVNQMLEDLPSLRDKADSDIAYWSGEAVEAAKASGVTTPVTYPFVTEWQNNYAESVESKNWFYATGGFKHATAGTVTVYPPTDSNPEWTYKYNYQVHMADRY
ncbi:MAG: hypothetical protein CSA82_03640, partial [Actinobacteria bacterium]